MRWSARPRRLPSHYVSHGVKGAFKLTESLVRRLCIKVKPVSSMVLCLEALLPFGTGKLHRDSSSPASAQIIRHVCAFAHVCRQGKRERKNKNENRNTICIFTIYVEYTILQQHVQSHNSKHSLQRDAMNSYASGHLSQNQC